VTYAANGSAPAAGGESASKHPSAGGNIGGRQRAELVAQDFDLYSWRCGCCGSGDVAVAQHTARSCSAEMPRRVACTAGFGTMASRGIPDVVPVLQRLQGHGRTVHARAHRRKERYACNEIKLLEKEFGTDRTAR
jgi:hypothetical protein